MNHCRILGLLAISVTACSGSSTLVSGGGDASPGATNDGGTGGARGGTTGNDASAGVDGSTGAQPPSGDGGSAGTGHDAGAANDAASGTSTPSAVCPGALGTRTAVTVSISGSVQNPSFSPDSSRLLFTNFVKGYNVGSSAIGIVPAAGGSPTMLLPADAQNVDLPGCWNAALNQIVISSDVTGPLDQIYRLDPAGVAAPFLVATPTMRAWEPSLSPDGQWVVYEAHTPSGGANDPGRIWKVKIDGTQATQLTPDTVDAKEPNWSPAGDRILYQAAGPGGGGSVDIFTIDTSGGLLANVTNGGTSENTDASWSPDGSSIVYSSDASGDSLASLFVIPVGGGKATRVTFGSGYDGAPSWSPDGKCIAFETSTQDPDGSPGTTIGDRPGALARKGAGGAPFRAPRGRP